MSVYDKLMKEMGKKNVRKIDHFKPLKKLSTGMIEFDMAIGGGLPMGRMTEIYGPPNTGKTTTSLLIMKEAINVALEQDKRVFYFAQEGDLDYSWCKRLGLPYEYDQETSQYVCTALGSDGQPVIDIFQADTAEQALEGLKLIIQTDGYVYGVVDSLAKMIPKNALEATLDKSIQIGLHARLITLFTNQIFGLLESTDLALVILNHVRDDINNQWNKYISPGGRAFHHDLALRLEMYPQKETWTDRTGKVHENIEFRFYQRKSKVGNSTSGLNSYFLYYDQEEDLYYTDIVNDLFKAARDLKLLTNAKGETFAGKGNAYFDAEKYNWDSTDFVEEEPRNELNHVWIGKDISGVLSFIKNNFSIFVALFNAYKQHTNQTQER